VLDGWHTGQRWLLLSMYAISFEEFWSKNELWFYSSGFLVLQGQLELTDVYAVIADYNYVRDNPFEPF